MLQKRKTPITVDSLIEYFLCEYIFKDVSVEAKCFLLANANLQQINPFKQERQYYIQKWNAFSEEEKVLDFQQRKAFLEDRRKEVASQNALTFEERAKQYEELTAKALADDLED